MHRIQGDAMKEGSLRSKLESTPAVLRLGCNVGSDISDVPRMELSAECRHPVVVIGEISLQVILLACSLTTHDTSATHVTCASLSTKHHVSFVKGCSEGIRLIVLMRWADVEASSKPVVEHLRQFGHAARRTSGRGLH